MHRKGFRCHFGGGCLACLDSLRLEAPTRSFYITCACGAERDLMKTTLSPANHLHLRTNRNSLSPTTNIRSQNIGSVHFIAGFCRKFTLKITFCLFFHNKNHLFSSSKNVCWKSYPYYALPVPEKLEWTLVISRFRRSFRRRHNQQKPSWKKVKSDDASFANAKGKIRL